MCTDLRLVKLADMHVSARTLDFGFEVDSTVRVVPRGQQWHATAVASAPTPFAWTNTLGFGGMTAFGFDQYGVDAVRLSLPVGSADSASTFALGDCSKHLKNVLRRRGHSFAPTR